MTKLSYAFKQEAHDLENRVKEVETVTAEKLRVSLISIRRNITHYPCHDTSRPCVQQAGHAANDKLSEVNQTFSMQLRESEESNDKLQAKLKQEKEKLKQIMDKASTTESTLRSTITKQQLTIEQQQVAC